MVGTRHKMNLATIYHYLSCQGGTCMNKMQFLASAAQILFGLSAAAIAYAQWGLNRNKAKFELYEKRYDAYKELQNFFGSVARSGKVEADDLVSFRWKFEEHYFLFGPKIRDYVKIVFDKSLELRGYEVNLWGMKALPPGAERNEVVEKQDKLLKWLLEQPNKSKKHFETYLRIK